MKGPTYIQESTPESSQPGDSWVKIGDTVALYFRVNNIWVRIGDEA